MAFLTTTIGSFPKPLVLHEARRRFAEGEIDAEALREVEDEAVRRVIALQEGLGVDIVVDGEMDRADPVTTFTDRLAGVEIAGWVRAFGDRYVRRPKIVGPLARVGATTVERWRFARDQAKGIVKAVIPGPYTLMDSSFDEHYGSRRDVCRAFAGIVRDEALELVAAGVVEIQLDEPSAGACERELSLLHDAVAHVTAPLAGRARMWVYLGYADLARCGEALATLPADGLLVAGAHDGYQGLERFTGALPAGRFVGIGVVDSLDSRVEEVEEIVARLERVADLVPRDRVWALPDGGFRALRAEVTRAKLANLVAAARAL